MPLGSRSDLEHGGVLEGGRVAFEAYGDPACPAVAVLGGISVGRHLAASDVDPTPGWWEPFVGPGRAVDTRAFRAIGIDFLGGAGASSGPEDVRVPNRGRASVGTADQARALRSVLDYLEIDRLHAVVGSSYGGMVGLAFAALCPDQVDRLVLISAPHRSHPMATALRSVQRKIVRIGLATGATEEALSVARGLAMTTYRTSREFAQRFETRPVPGNGSLRFPVDDYLDSRGATFAGAFGATAFLGLSESLDLHDVRPGDVITPATVVSVRSDTLVPPWQLRELSNALAGPSELVEIDSIYGHDAFLKEVDALSAVVERALGSGEVAS